MVWSSPRRAQFFLRLHGLWEGVVNLPRPPPPPFDIETMEPIEPPWQAIKEWIADAPIWPSSWQDPPPDLVFHYSPPKCGGSVPDEEPDLDGVQPSPESFKSRPGWHRPKPNMAGTRNPVGRRPHPGFRIHLTSRQTRRKTAAKRNFDKAVWRATLTANENRREISRVSRLPARTGDFSYRNTAH